MAGEQPRICASIVGNDLESIDGVTPLVDLFEVRIDLIGKSWKNVASRLKKPWIACNRRLDEGGKWSGTEKARIKQLWQAIDLGAQMIDIELSTSAIQDIVFEMKGKTVCLVSYHDLKRTPPLNNLRQVIINQMAAGADICKIVTTARGFTDNLLTLQLIKEFSTASIVSFAMGAAGQISRILCPLVGGYFTYASVKPDKESAPGQITVKDLRKIYAMLER